MRILLITLLATILLTACGADSHSRALKLSDLIFGENRLGDECSLAETDSDGTSQGNPVLSSESGYVEKLTTQWLDEESADRARKVLIASYYEEGETGEVRLIGIEFDSNSSANSAAKLLKKSHPDESCNIIYRENDIVIWLKQDNDSTDKCFKKFEDLVEEEVREAGLDILKHF
ncbi:MAG: hypothetical protein R6U37_09140 [Dehalococcoidia bacterium]